MGSPTTRSSNGKGQGRGSGSYTRSGRGYNRNRSSNTHSSVKKEQQSTTSGQIKFQLHGQKIRQTATYTKVLENLIVKIQNTFDRLINIVKSHREKIKHAPDEPKGVRIKIEGTDEQKEEKVFEQNTKDIQYT